MARLARQQHGVVARWQLLELGFSPDAIDHRLARGRLHPIQRGVYAVGHTILGAAGRWMAAVLAIGGATVLSHRSAAALWHLRPSSAGRTDVTAPRRLPSRRTIAVHFARLPEDEVAIESGIPVTTAARTVCDLAPALPRHQVERLMEQADSRRLAGPVSLHDLLERYPRRAGAPMLRAIIASTRLDRITRSDLEALCLVVVRDASVPMPETNVWLTVGGRGFEVDCVWQRERVIVELDSRAHHLDRIAFEEDRERDRFLQAAGWHVIRVTWRQLVETSRAVAADLNRLLRPPFEVNRVMGG